MFSGGIEKQHLAVITITTMVTSPLNYGRNFWFSKKIFFEGVGGFFALRVGGGGRVRMGELAPK